MKKSQIKSCFMFILLTLLLAFIVYAVSTTLESPVDNYTDTDGYLDLRASCEPTSINNYDGTTVWNITNATLWSNVGGNWIANVTLHAVGAPLNSTYYFNFTNHINQSAEGEYKWNVQCNEHNVSDNTVIQKSFAGNNTIIVRYARPIITTTSPADGTYSLNGHEISVVCTGQSSTGWNLTSISLMTSIKGGLNWTINQTHTPVSPAEAAVVVNFTINKFGNASIPDGTNLLFGCSANQQINLSNSGNEPFVTSEKSSVNRTVNIEYPPGITLNNPPDNNWSKNQRVNISWFVTSIFGSGISPFPCQVWTNDTGMWGAKAGTVNVVNNTYQDLYVDFVDQTALKWGVKCWDINDGNVWNMSTNRTINIDTTNPTISSVTPTNYSYVPFGDNLTIKFTPSDSTLSLVKVYVDGSVNYTNTSVTSGTEITYIVNVSLSDAKYNFSIWANDSAGRTYTTGNYTVTMDTTKPGFLENTTMNVSVAGYCDKRNLTWDTSEPTNYTIYFDTDTTTSDGDYFYQSTYTLNHSVIFDYNFSAEILHYFDITTCDQSGNCNTTGQKTFTTPARVCAGWSQYAVYSNTINLSDVQNQSGADLVYFWNATDQTWTYFTAGLTANGHTLVGRNTDYQVVHLYEDTNSTWFRYQVNAGVYNYNISSIHNFISIPRLYNFGNLTYSFMNESNSYPSIVQNHYTNFTQYGPFNITYFAGYNNSAQDYVSHIHNFTWSNGTFIEPCPGRKYPATCMETAWVASGFNVSWDGSNIYANWTA